MYQDENFWVSFREIIPRCRPDFSELFLLGARRIFARRDNRFGVFCARIRPESRESDQRELDFLPSRARHDAAFSRLGIFSRKRGWRAHFCPRRPCWSAADIHGRDPDFGVAVQVFREFFAREFSIFRPVGAELLRFAGWNFGDFDAQNLGENFREKRPHIVRNATAT